MRMPPEAQGSRNPKKSVHYAFDWHDPREAAPA